MKNQILTEIGKCGLAFLAGVLLTLSCAPFYVFPLALVSAAFLLLLWLDVTPQIAWRRGFCYGLGLFGSGVYWVYISMHTYADLPAWAAGLLTVAFIALLSLFPAIQGWTLNRYFPKTNHTKMLCAFPAIWVFFEWVRSWIFSGFPWLFIGYSQTHSPLKGYAPLASVYGVSLVTVLSAALIVDAVLSLRRQERTPAYLCILAVVVIWTQGILLNFISWTQPEGRPLQVSLVQANIPQHLKWLPEQVMPTLQEYRNLSQDHWDSQVVIWPEAAIPAPLDEVTEFVDEMSDTAKLHHSQLIAGIPVKNIHNNRYFNAVISVGNDGVSYYLKRRLVPFGEFIPFEHLLGRAFGFMNIPMSDFTPATGLSEPLTVRDNIKMLAFICYEIAFPEQVRQSLKEVNILLTVTNDAWFGHSIAQAQHLQMAQMRAIENGRPVLFASNNGITAFISPQGHLLYAAPPFKTFVLTGNIQAYTGKTPWQRYAMDPLLLILLSLIIVAVKYRRA